MNWNKIKKVVGPGILFASTAIGVSHLVQSTRAGANYGFALLLIIILANILKFPFFEYGARYANVKGESLIDGYKRLGKYALWIYFFIILGSMFFVTAAVGKVTAGFMDNLFGLSTLFPSFKLFPEVLVFLICFSILILGKFNYLDNFIKIIGVFLLISTLLAFTLVLIKGPSVPITSFTSPSLFDDNSIVFIIALMGWMPTAIDLSTWISLWTLEKIKTTRYQPSLKETLFDFNLGYWISAFLSICFLVLGAFLFYGTGKVLPKGSAGFANEVISLYASVIGNWSYIIIAISAFSIMLGTSLGVFDGYARVLQKISELLFLNNSNSNKKTSSNVVYKLSLSVLAIGAFLIISLFAGQFKTLVDLATSISFLIAPLIAIANLKLVGKKYLGDAAPGKFMQIISYLGIIFLTGFAVFFVYIKL